jgi:hypothetical protein
MADSLSRGARSLRRESTLAGITAFALIAAVSHLRSASYNNYVILANAFLHGHIAIDNPSPWVDAVHYRDTYYIIEGPIPAILMMPFVALYGTSANQTLLAALLAGFAIRNAWELARRLSLPRNACLWMCGFLFLGTDLFWCAMLGDVWFIAHVSAVAFTLAALLELQGKRRAWLVVLYAVCAAGSRFSLAPAIPVYLAILLSDTDTETRKKRLRAFCITLAPFILLAICYNEIRWHLPYDIGYTLWYQRGDPRSPDAPGYGSPFQLRYLGYELYSFFLRLPQPISQYPYLIPTFDGIALTWTSPALFLAFFAHQPKNLVRCLWIATLLTAAPSFIYYVNGLNQFGMRHALDFEPFLFLLMLHAVRERIPSWGKILCAYSMIVGAWGLWYWLHFYR